MKNGHILIADDDQTLCYLLKEELINEGYTVDITFDGKYAIENLKKKAYDLLLLDLEMTEVQGEEVLKYTKENHPSLQGYHPGWNPDLRFSGCQRLQWQYGCVYRQSVPLRGVFSDPCLRRIRK